ncbi:diaminopimelate epimerase [Roseivirga misakiensis]|uniref:Diaminopimelate epimerase n=1 Tax=Roseivirga misakiensis TaxID=1563681 RepID=A0A1E5T3S8_9BACT|nr:diaminopimelate epimerase [Roseivirga misakiensis]OEK05927.1 diaminopimelate epimerase [Roseivirga misakiensis]
MAIIQFHKYQGTGNDFVMIDNCDNAFDKDDLDLVSKLCDRRFGIGADGVILIEPAEDVDFNMIYFNPDGSQSLCGNGSRCAVMFAKHLGLIQNETTFRAIDGIHEAKISGDQVSLLMHDVLDFEQIGDDFLIDTGSPHYLKYVTSTDDIDPLEEGRKVRYSERFAAEGVNVNFLEQINDGALKIRTYERGVEGETYSCGTGCTAAALSLGLKSSVNEVALKAIGGDLRVSFTKDGETFRNIYLIGPAKKVFAGEFGI